MQQSSSSSFPAEAIESLDALFAAGGLTRHPRQPQALAVRPRRLDRSSAEELTPPRPAGIRAANGVEWLPIPGWDLPWLWSGFSTRRGGFSRAYCPEDAPGELNLGLTADDDRATVLANRRLLAEAITGDAETPLAVLRQFHSNRIVDAASADALRPTPGQADEHKADGQMTAEPGLLLGVQTADCIPVLVADRRQRIVAAFHAGWRGTVKRIVETGIGRMRLCYGSRPQDLMAAIGPGIAACCYAVGEEVLAEFESQFAYARDLFHEVFSSDAIRIKYPLLFLTQRAPGHSPIGPGLHIDLVDANRRQLLDGGLSPQSIQVVGGCTVCHSDLFFSHRASQGHAGRMMAVIGIHQTAKPRSARRKS